MNSNPDGGPPTYTCRNCGTHWTEVQMICPHCGAPWANSNKSLSGLTRVARGLAAACPDQDAETFDRLAVAPNAQIFTGPGTPREVTDGRDPHGIAGPANSGRSVLTTAALCNALAVSALVLLALALGAAGTRFVLSF